MLSVETKSVADRFDAELRRLQQIGAEFHGRGWSLGTSSNYSAVVNREPLQLLLTASGKDKGRLGDGDFVLVDGSGRNVEADARRPSAETLLHCVLARQPGVGAVLHTHSIWGTVLSDAFFPRGRLAIEGYEMLKGLAGVSTHEYRAEIEIFENTQDIASLASIVESRLDDGERPLGPLEDTERPLRHGFLIRRHGLYTWGRDLEEARRHVEVLEFLFEVVGRKLEVAGIPGASRSP
jgi:methylthioribulose-1-phosphate dehydratase